LYDLIDFQLLFSVATDIRTDRATNFFVYKQTMEFAIDHHFMIAWISWLS